MRIEKRGIDANIEPATDKDTARLTYLYRKLYEGDEDLDFFRSKATPSYFRSGSKVFVARLDGEIEGFVWVVYYEHIANKGVGVIEELYVNDNYRRRGIGRKLITKAIEYLKKMRATVVLVTTESHKVGAKKFYKAIGFKISKTWFFYSLQATKNKETN